MTGRDSYRSFRLPANTSTGVTLSTVSFAGDAGGQRAWRWERKQGVTVKEKNSASDLQRVLHRRAQERQHCCILHESPERYRDILIISGFFSRAISFPLLRSLVAGI